MKSLENLLSRFNITYEKHKLESVVTHNSFSENNHSRYVFLGMFAFKGVVAHWIFNHVAGTGTQLQNYLGNIFKPSFLETFFDKYIQKIIRIDNKIDINTQKHIFTYAFFGFVYDNATENQLQEFIFHQIIKLNDHHLPSNYKHKNYWDQLLFLCKQQYDCKPKLTSIENEDKTQLISITINNEIIAQHQSISFKYAKKKVIKIALDFVTKQLENQLKQNPTYQENEKLKLKKELETLEKQKQEKQEKHIARNLAHQEKMQVRREEKKKQAQEEDKKRRLAKEKAKEKTARKGADTIYRSYTTEEIATMSASKRRNLQDKGIIPKGLNF